jgi:hypothetical protein
MLAGSPIPLDRVLPSYTRKFSAVQVATSGDISALIAARIKVAGGASSGVVRGGGRSTVRRAHQQRRQTLAIFVSDIGELQADLIRGIGTVGQPLNPCHPRPHTDLGVAGRQEVKLELVARSERLIRQSPHASGTDIDRTALVVEQV